MIDTVTIRKNKVLDLLMQLTRTGGAAVHLHNGGTLGGEVVDDLVGAGAKIDAGVLVGDQNIDPLSPEEFNVGAGGSAVVAK